MSINQDLAGHVQELVAEALQISEDMITADLAFGDIPQWDSLGHMEIILRLEDAYNIPIDTELIARLVSIRDICHFVEESKHVQS